MGTGDRVRTSVMDTDNTDLPQLKRYNSLSSKGTGRYLEIISIIKMKESVTLPFIKLPNYLLIYFNEAAHDRQAYGINGN